MNSHRVTLRGWIALLVLASFLSGGEKTYCQFAASTLRSGAVPAWVNSTEADYAETNSEAAAGGQAFILLDTQANAGTAEIYLHFVKEITSTTGVQNGANLEFSWDPSYQRLTIHHIIVRRGADRINRLELNRFKIFQQETDINRQIYNGTLSAVLFLEDVRVGDRIEYDYTVAGDNPSLAGKFADSFLLAWPMPVHERKLRVLIPEDRKLNYVVHGQQATPTIRHLPETTEYSWSLRDVPAVAPEDQIPSWFTPYPWLEMSEYTNWTEVAQWAERLFAPTNLDSTEIQEAVTELRHPGDTAEQAVQRAFEFVQNDVRYLGIEFGPNSFRPSDPAKVLRQRFGDCKDKALLLSVLVRKLGYEARPVLVSTRWRHIAPDLLPAPSVFNHAIVQVTANGQTYWLDPTRSFQRGPIATRRFSHYGYGLLVDPRQTGLTPLPAPDPHEAFSETDEHFRIHGQKQPADLSITTTYTGSDAEWMRALLGSEGREQIGKDFLNTYARYYPEIKAVEPIAIIDATNKDSIVVVQSYVISNFWTLAKDKARYVCDFYPQSIHAWTTKPSITMRHMPMELSFPRIRAVRTRIELPREFRLSAVTNIITGPAAQLRIARTYNGRTLWLNYDYSALTNYVPPALTAKHLASLDEMERVLGYSLTWQNMEGGVARNQFNWPIFLLAVCFTGMVGGGAGLFCYMQCRSAGPSENAAPPLLHQNLNGLGGWLILVAFALLINPIRLIFVIIKNVNVFSLWKWQALTTPGTESYNSVWAPLLMFELLGQITLILFMAIGIVLFFQKRRLFPRWYIAALLVNALFVLGDVIGFHFLGTAATAQMRQILDRSTLSAFVGCMIWIPYMLKSERVKATFIR